MLRSFYYYYFYSDFSSCIDMSIKCMILIMFVPDWDCYCCWMNCYEKKKRKSTKRSLLFK